MANNMQTIYGTPNGITTFRYQNVAAWTFEKRLMETFGITLPLLGPEAGEQLKAILSVETIAIIAATLVAWIVSHAFGLGEIIDVILLVVGAVAIGWSIFTAVDHLYDFATGVYNAKTPQDLHKAADHLAKAIAIIGIQAVLAILCKGAKGSPSYKGGRVNPGNPPPANGLSYQPKLTFGPLPPGVQGSTGVWGDIVVSSALRGGAKIKEVLIHEKVHQFLAPKLVFLRKYRASNQAASYSRSSLWRYIEEALAQTIAEVGVNGMKSVFKGLRFPIENGYMYLRQGGGYRASWGGAGLIPEATALVHKGAVSGLAFELYFYKSGSFVDPARFYIDLYKESFLGDSDIREWVFAQTPEGISDLGRGMLASLVNRLLDGWLCDDDVKAIGIIYRAIEDPTDKQFVGQVISLRLLDIADLGQRTSVRLILGQ